MDSGFWILDSGKENKAELLLCCAMLLMLCYGMVSD